MISGDQESRREWQRLYDALVATLGKVGEECPYGDKDFWVVDDYHHLHHKVYFWRWTMLTASNIRTIQSIVRDRFPAWTVMVQVDNDDLPRHAPPVGVIITAERIQEDLPRDWIPAWLPTLELDERVACSDCNEPCEEPRPSRNPMRGVWPKGP